MARYTGPKRRLSRREGLPLFSKDIKALERGVLPPGQHGAKMRRRLSEYGLQLRGGQKKKKKKKSLEKKKKKLICMVREKKRVGVARCLFKFFFFFFLTPWQL